MKLNLTIGVMIAYSTWWYSIWLIPAAAILFTWHFDDIRNWYLRWVYWRK